jgi:tetratricopeptide (TPR) repeat protein
VSRSALRVDDALIGGVALAVRLLHAWFVAQTPFFEGPVIDAFAYRAFAQHIAQTGDFGGAFYQPPLYPAFLALLFRSGLTSAWSIAFVQALLGALTAVLLAHSARRLCSDGAWARRAGLLCGLATALYGPLVLFDVELLPPCCVDLCFAAALCLSLRNGAWGLSDAGLGLLLGLGVVAWPPFSVFVPVLLALRVKKWPKPRHKLCALVLACAALPLAFTARHNAAHAGQGVVVSYNLGINLWLGNNVAWRDTWRARPGAAFEPELERPDREGVTTPAARSSYFTRIVARDVAARPLAAVTRTAEKLYYVWHGREIRRDNDTQLLREASPVLRGLLWEKGLLFPFGLVAPLGLLAFWRRRTEPQVRYLAAGAAAYGLLVAVFFVSSRYRLPLALLLLPFAVDQALFLARHWRQAPRTVWLGAGFLLLLLNLPNAFTASFAAAPAERGILTAHAWRNQGDAEAADRLSDQLAASFPDDANVRMLRSEQLIAGGRCAEAERHLRRVIELMPRSSAPRILLADCLAALGQSAAAELAYANVLAIHPYHPVALKQVGALYLRARRPREAKALLARFVASGYSDPEVSGWLARLNDDQVRQRMGRSGL